MIALFILQENQNRLRKSVRLRKKIYKTAWNAGSENSSKTHAQKHTVFSDVVHLGCLENKQGEKRIKIRFSRNNLPYCI